MGLLDWFRTKRKEYAAEEFHRLATSNPMKYPQWSYIDSEPIEIILKTAVPKFTRNLAALQGMTLETYLDKFLTTTLYMEQGSRVENQPIVFDKTVKKAFYTKGEIKNPLIN